MNILTNHALAPWTWWKIGGPAENLVLPTNLEEVLLSCQLAQDNKWPLTVLGGGSNVLICDEGLRGLVLATRHLAQVESVQEIDNPHGSGQRLQIICGAGTNKSELFKIFMKYKLAPAQFLCGLPGEIGGGIVMNAGVGESLTPREFVELVDWIEVVPFSLTHTKTNTNTNTNTKLPKKADSNTLRRNVQRYTRAELHWGYRHCTGWPSGVIVRVALSWPLEPDENLAAKVRAATKMRVEKQPLNQASGGSVFRNPPGQKAGALIEKAGLKGFQIGQAQVSLKHANFIVNLGEATARDVRAVMEHVQAQVQAQMGVLLVPEVKLLGFI